ncbi:MAG: SDR family oxidoreductase [Betaproteobacteria bacterium]|nr:MAG: SDR family oxidoreductase [Betaproteobacteria bacterium]
MDLGIKGLRVLVTAGAGGIGLKVAEAFTSEGASVYTCDIDPSALDALGKAHPGIGSSVCDVSDRTAVAKLFDEAIKTLGGLDCLVNNAGIAGPTGPVHEIDPEQWDRCLEVCLTGQFNCARLAVAHLRRSSNPSIINLSSAAGRFGFPNRSPYAAAKWGVVGFTKTLSMELGQYGIRCNAILPGTVEGKRIRDVIEAKAKIAGRAASEVQDDWLAKASIREMIQPEQLADMILFLASTRGRTLSGQAISIDGDLQALL